MPSQPALPPLLTSYLSPSAQSGQSLTLITSVLAATSNWLILRYLISYLSSSETIRGSDSDSSPGPRSRKVVLVSFLRNWDFWRAEAKRLGLDLQKLAEGDKFRFVDGLSELYKPTAPKQIRLAQSRGVCELTRATPVRGPAPGLGRAPLAPAVRQPETSSSSPPSPSSSSTPKQVRISGHGSAALDGLEKDILNVISSLRSPDEDDTLLIIDQPDLLLAATPGVNTVDVSEWIMGLRQHVYSALITTSADSPLIHSAYTAGEEGTATPLETQHSAFVIGLAHRARMVMQLRTLDTGAAKDVSGVLRISRGGAYDDTDQEMDEKEVLYFVQRDGGVRVFGRGEA